jgi:hypothetical protein
MEEVEHALHHLKRNKAAGEDGIPAELRQSGGESLLKELQKLIACIWRQQKMPPEWLTGIITVLHKKGDTTNCDNYRGLTLLNTAYKVLSRVLYQRLEQEASDLCGEYQAGFRRNRATSDHIFSLRQTIEKCGEFNIDLHILFIDFRKAYDSIKHCAIWKALEDLGIQPKLIRMLKITLRGANSKVRFAGTTSSSFPVGVGLRQGDGLSTLLFNLVLEWVMRKVLSPEQMKRTIYTSKSQLLAYADDIALLARSLIDLKELFNKIEKFAEEVGLQVNESKTKYLAVSKSERMRHRGQNLTVGPYNFERFSTSHTWER